jgi:hypothetical protein
MEKFIEVFVVCVDGDDPVTSGRNLLKWVDAFLCLFYCIEYVQLEDRINQNSQVEIRLDS